jgi:uncharacterized membrane protein
MKRIRSIDITRGLAMVIMALDHVRDLIHVDSLSHQPTDLATTTPILFFTRFITHLCAPIFVFLAGTSVYISFQKQGNIRQTRNFLFKRGLWLIVLEFTVINFAIFGDIRFHLLTFLVIATIGFGFIMLGLMLSLSPKTIGIIGLSIIFLHNLFPLIPFEEGSVFKQVLTPFFSPTAIPVSPERTFIMGYPPIPWLGIMLTGFAAGPFFSLEASKRNQLFIKIGLSSLLLFLILRFIKIYGDPVPWSVQKNGVYTFLSFMNITKYPPSLLFCLFTLGTMFMILALIERTGQGLKGFLSVYGQVPMFYFIAHFYLIHVLLVIILLIQGVHWNDMDFSSGTYGRPKGVTTGVSFGMVYLIWAFVVLILYQPCRWFGRYKKENSYWWLKYI